MKTYHSIASEKERLYHLDDEMPPRNRYIWVMDSTCKAFMKSDTFLWCFAHDKRIAVGGDEISCRVPARSMTHWTLSKNRE
jgi:hypothetical protein